MKKLLLAVLLCASPLVGAADCNPFVSKTLREDIVCSHELIGAKMPEAAGWTRSFAQRMLRHREQLLAALDARAIPFEDAVDAWIALQQSEKREIEGRMAQLDSRGRMPAAPTTDMRCEREYASPSGAVRCTLR